MRMRRLVGSLMLAVFMAYMGAYLYVYMTRSFQVDRPRPLEFVGLYHGDNFSRVLLVGILFLIAEVFVVYLAIAARRPQRVDVRIDLWQWLKAREQLTGEPAAVIAERAIAQYRLRLEGGPGARVPSASVSTSRRD